jgi:hypothetical protein
VSPGAPGDERRRVGVIVRSHLIAMEEEGRGGRVDIGKLVRCAGVELVTTEMGG